MIFSRPLLILYYPIIFTEFPTYGKLNHQPSVLINYKKERGERFVRVVLLYDVLLSVMVILGIFQILLLYAGH